jgi:hypothetical protein
LKQATGATVRRFHRMSQCNTRPLAKADCRRFHEAGSKCWRSLIISKTWGMFSFQKSVGFHLGHQPEDVGWKLPTAQTSFGKFILSKWQQFEQVGRLPLWQ